MDAKEQTAVEWLEMEIVRLEKLFPIPNVIYRLCELAKEKEKQQIIAANEDCSTNELGELLTGKQYYNETYGGEK